MEDSEGETMSRTDEMLALQKGKRENTMGSIPNGARSYHIRGF